MKNHNWKWVHVGGFAKGIEYKCLDCGATATSGREMETPTSGCSGFSRDVATSTSGLYEKYRITRTDGEPIPEEARFFVLRLDRPTDSAERAALRVYAIACKLRRPDLAEDLFALLASLPPGF